MVIADAEDTDDVPSVVVASGFWCDNLDFAAASHHAGNGEPFAAAVVAGVSAEQTPNNAQPEEI